MRGGWNHDDFVAGIGLPMLRAWGLIGAVIVIALAALLIFRSGNVFFAVLIFGFLVLCVLEHRRRADREDEKRAMNRFLGLPEDE